MFKKVITCICLTISITFSALVSPLYAVSSGDDYNAQAVSKILQQTNVFDLKSKSSILIDSLSGGIIIEKNSHEKLPVASVTKVMSMLLAMEAIDTGKIKMDDMVSVSEQASGMGGSQAYLKVGEQFTVKDMLKAIAIHSSNDCTVALAEKISGSETTFVNMMNDKAKSLGMNDTNFMDCTGLTDDGHYSSAYDIALMSRELVNKYPKILEFTSVWHDTFRNGTFSLDNTNKLIRFYTGSDGLKTGFTSKAGYCLSATAKRGNLRLISVVLGASDTNTRFAESRKLLDYGFANFDVTTINKKGDVVKSVSVIKGVQTTVNAVYKEDVMICVQKGNKANIEKQINIPESLNAPLKGGQKLGEVQFKIGDKLCGVADAVCEKDVEVASFIRLFFRMILNWIGLGR